MTTRNAAVFLALLVLVVLGQWLGGAYRAEFIGETDEAAHHVTGMMVHDYVAAGLPWPPMQFAQKFHEQYPRVALGHWPPLFYVLEAAWMFVFGDGRYSILLLIASIQALWAFLCWKLFGRFLGPVESWLATLYLIATPEALVRGRLVMTEILVALLVLAAVLALHKLIDQPGWKWSLAFGALASAAILAKGTGVFLAPLPILAVFTLRRWDLLKSPWFWLPAAMVAATCGPWYALAPFALHEKAARFGDPYLRTVRFDSLFHHFAAQLTWPGLALSLLGWWRTMVRIVRRDEQSPLWILLAWAIPVAWAFHVYIGAWQSRHLVMVAPFMMLFAATGLRWIFDKLGQPKPVLRWAAAVIVLAVAARHVVALEKKPHRGLDEVAKQILNRPEFARSPLLIVSDSVGEGAFIS
jgi:4-amino-4-deoxy-L-arabinose transferase-like glycosyltransferase